MQKVAGGVVVDDETLAVDLIGKVGPNGTYLSEKHTRRHMKEIWRPTVWDRTPYDVWLAGGKKGALDTATAIADDILANYRSAAAARRRRRRAREHRGARRRGAGRRGARHAVSGARLVVWDDEACWQVHEATLALLEEAGVEVPFEPARELLAAAGARVSGTRVRIPAALVDGALGSAPRRFVLKSRAGGGDAAATPAHAAATDAESTSAAAGIELADGHSFFGTGPDCDYVRDPDSGERRPATTADVQGMAALCERLPGIDFVMSMARPADAPAETDDLTRFAAMLAGTRKPLLATVRDADSLPLMAELAAICGEAQSFACYALSAPPLAHSAEALRQMTVCARAGIPFVYAPAPVAGVSAPASVAGTVLVGNAEVLSALVVHQLAAGGAPFVLGVGCGTTDRHTALETFGAPELYLGNAAACDLCHFYGLPSFAYAGRVRRQAARRAVGRRGGHLGGARGALARHSAARRRLPRSGPAELASRRSCSATSSWATRAPSARGRRDRPRLARRQGDRRGGLRRQPRRVAAHTREPAASSGRRRSLTATATSTGRPPERLR